MSDLKIVESEHPVKLDLGCGDRCEPGYTGVDFFMPGAEKVDLFKFPWPWADSSVDALHSSHFLEHIPAREVTAADLSVKLKKGESHPYIGKDMLCVFMDEAYRILKPQGEFKICVPNARSNRAFQDPTHRRFFVQESFFYFSAAWREQQKLGHYLCNCDFGFEIGHTMPAELGLLSPEVQARRFSECWNTVFDWIVRMVSNKKASS